MDEQIEKYCWKIKASQKFREKLTPFVLPRLSQTIEFLGLSFRYLKFYKRCQKKKVQPHMDFFNPVHIKQMYGVPIGGIGTGSIGRSFSGDFCRFQLVPGLYEHSVAEASMFTVCIRKKSSTVYQQALVTRRSNLKGLRSWNMAFSPDHCSYSALYPESWLVYDLPGQNVKLTCHQLSPIIPHNYKDSSLPCALFNWTCENNNREDIELSLMFTWQSGSSSNKFELTNVKAMPFESKGVLLEQKLRNMPLTYCIGANQNVTYNCQFYVDNEESSSQLWLDLLNDGKLNNKQFTESDQKNGGQQMAVAVCVQVKIKANSKENIEFSLVWHMPVVSFSENTVKYKRFYTRHFADTNSVTTAKQIAAYAHAQRSNWMKEIRKWQMPILQNENLPLWYKRVLFNELYFIADGGTVWFDIKDDTNSSNVEAHEYVKENGRFAYLEGHEYRMYNTYDVHFYASFALLKLWPKLQMSLQYDFATTIKQDNKTQIQYLYYGQYNKQKTENSVPHDIGDPESEPWVKLNAYNSHDTKDWRDLNLKFILTCYRDYYYTQDEKYLRHMWPLIQSLMVTVDSQDLDKDGLIDSAGDPDQTYDAWSVTGASAYCGGLHIASLQCVCKIAELLNDDETLLKYKEKLEKAKRAYDSKLWNGKYYKYDCSNRNHNDSIMADMCCGHWFLRASGFKHEAFDKEKIKSCLDTIFEFNVMKYGQGKRGAVNGMRPNGQVDITSMQSEEVWIGVNDAVASLMLFEGLNDKAWKTLEGLYDLMYNELGLAFQTPEALLGSNVYRSLGYMRPLCLWSMQYALDELELNERK